MLENSVKIQIVKQVIDGVAQQLYRQELTLKMQEAYNEREDVLTATRANINRQQLALATLEAELLELEA